MSKIQKYCLACDLKEDPALIDEYKKHHLHGNIWPEIIKSIKDSGIENMEIYLTGNRLFMIIEADESFDLEYV